MNRTAPWAICGLAAVSILAQAAAQTPGRDGGQLSINSDTQEANTKTGEIIARGNVHIEYPARKVIADAEQATYLTKEKKIILQGNVRAVQGDNRIDAEIVTYLIKEGVFKAEPKEKGKQVRSIYTVPPDEQQTSDATPTQKQK
ncbi:LptA/OstA family protein [Gloeobacter kilaueensis]|uniref:Organic solvent tolerance-like N-terminal domain-containing protein n=1 Tax=Gloeobacter kilaueensis (strain ATCC BAA-2537 / CCAP 1431/1 / ULC 316 / JS1) TaxID=1183438 RepID=U5QMH5_GLOK1|nr:LptA/OstA family protein [Gloeobacter kilaueensis]AGY60098.1 hypothetical protein GKIL_3852 [Gloeobacter kilaueensis JS1]